MTGLRVRGSCAAVQVTVDLAVCVPFFAGAVLLEKFAIRKARDWQPHDTWSAALRARRLIGRPWERA